MGLLSKGKMELTLDELDYAPGETITGKLDFTLKQPVKARGVFLRLIGEDWRGTGSPSPYYRSPRALRREAKHPKMAWQKAYATKKIPLDGERQYMGGGTYRIKMKIPEDVLGSKTFPRRFFLRGNLDVPRGFDLKTKVPVSIHS